MRKVWMLAAVGAVASLVLAQEEKVLRVDVDLVNVLFNVKDKKGALIGSLTKEDFTLYEDGKQQTIKQFTRESDLPLTIGLLVDVSRSQENLIEIEKHAAAQFFQQVLRPKDMAFLISFGSEAELLQDYTNSYKLLRNGLDKLRVVGDVGGFHPGPVPTASRPKGTILFDAVYLAAADQLKGQVGRKALVLITDGMDMGSRYKIEQAIEAAQRADAIIFSIYYVDQSAYGYGYFGGVSDGDLKRMSEETGGQLFKVDRKNTLDEIFKKIQEGVRTQYSLAYTPTNQNKDGSFRKIEIKPASKEYKALARKGYYATAESR